MILHSCSRWGWSVDKTWTSAAVALTWAVMLTKKTSKWMKKICREGLHLILTLCLSLRIGITRMLSSPMVTKSLIMVSSSSRAPATRIYMRVKLHQALKLVPTLERSSKLKMSTSSLCRQPYYIILSISTQ